MERLTEKTIGCFKYDLKDHEHKIGEFATYDAFFNYSMAVKKLGEYEDAEEKRLSEPQTNADHIRSMSDEELANFFEGMHTICRICSDREYDCSEETIASGRCAEGIVEWLKQPFEEKYD